MFWALLKNWMLDDLSLCLCERKGDVGRTMNWSLLLIQKFWWACECASALLSQRTRKRKARALKILNKEVCCGPFVCIHTYMRFDVRILFLIHTHTHTRARVHSLVLLPKSTYSFLLVVAFIFCTFDWCFCAHGQALNRIFQNRPKKKKYKLKRLNTF